MRLDVVSATGAAVTAIEDLDPFLETGTRAVRLDAVSRVLDGIRLAAAALTPADSALREANPARMAMVAQTILAVSASAKKLANEAAAADPSNADAQTVLGALSQLHL